VAASNAPTAAELAEHQPDPSFAVSGQDGEIIYLANCAACHGRHGDGDGSVRTLPPAGGLAEPVSRMSSAELSYRIANGMAGTPMPAFAATLTEAERWHLVRYLEDRWRQR
jgi:mono/diheme cytochrome c family protein